MSSVTTPIWISQRAQLTPDRIGLIFKDESYTFNEIFTQAYQWAALLYEKGVRENDHVGVSMGNSPRTVFIIHALHLLGAKTVLLNRRLQPRELIWQLENVKATCFIHDNDFPDTGLIDICVDTLKDFSSAEQPELRNECCLDDVCSIMYTSGTTGKPKGVLQTYGNHWWSATGSAFNIGLNQDDAWLAAVPLFHISGYTILMKSVIYGMTVILYDHFDEEAINHELINGNVTIISVVATMLSRLLENLGDRQYDEKFRCMLLGGGPAPLPMLMECKKKSIPVYQTYGMTETASQIVTLAPEYALTKLGSAGKPLFPCQVKINSLNGESQGEIFVKGPNVTCGYWERPEANEESFEQGWLKTGDIGYIDEEGFLYVLDRRSDLIISGGENIYPAEIEAVLLSHPKVREAGVVGKEDSKWGQVPVAFIVSDQEVNESEILDFVRSDLASYKVPKQIIFVRELPRNSSNKLLRKELRNQL